MKIETKRLVIRYFEESDAEDLYEYLSKEEVVKYEPYDPYTHEKAAAEAKKRAGSQNFYAVALKEGKVIGNLFLQKGDFDTWELGYVFNSDYWGKGYARESGEALISHAFSVCHARKISAMCNPLNESSWKLLERLGFMREGRLRKNVYFFLDAGGNPIWQDTYEYGLLKEEWKALMERRNGK
ncbi:GNAT family protein [Lachnospiraceae bacterium 54-53]